MPLRSWHIQGGGAVGEPQQAPSKRHSGSESLSQMASPSLSCFLSGFGGPESLWNHLQSLRSALFQGWLHSLVHSLQGAITLHLAPQTCLEPRIQDHRGLACAFFSHLVLTCLKENSFSSHKMLKPPKGVGFSLSFQHAVCPAPGAQAQTGPAGLFPSVSG